MLTSAPMALTVFFNPLFEVATYWVAFGGVAVLIFLERANNAGERK